MTPESHGPEVGQEGCIWSRLIASTLVMAVPGAGRQAEMGSLPVSDAVRSFALAVQNSHRSQPTRSAKRRTGGLSTHRVSYVTRGSPTSR